jgi:antirestriction protein ArdC
MSVTYSTAARKDVAAEITAKIISSLEAGVMPWRRPWYGSRVSVSLPRRSTGDFYRGVNTILLWYGAAARGYTSPYWLSFKQAAHHGAHVRKSERGETVVYYGSGSLTEVGADGTETEARYRFLKSYTVFNADQIDGLPDRFYLAPSAVAVSPLLKHEAWFQKLDIARILTRDVACYIPSRDVIGMPPLAAFDDAETYAATLNHEAVHATAASHRVGRDLSKRFKAAIAAEELVAEIGAAILGAHLHLPPDHIFDHAAYIESWMSILQSDKRAFFHAAAQAQLAVDWLIAKSPPPDVADV